jgi:hypothetical protein
VHNEWSNPVCRPSETRRADVQALLWEEHVRRRVANPMMLNPYFSALLASLVETGLVNV